MSKRGMGRTRLMMRVYHAPARPRVVLPVGRRESPPSPFPVIARRTRGAARGGQGLLRVQPVEALLEPAGVRALGAGQGLEPLRDLLEALLAGGLREAGVHRRVLVGLAGDRRLEVLGGIAERLAGRGIADALQVIEVAVRVAGLALGGVAEQARDVGLALDVGDLREVEVATVRLRLAGEGF